MPWKIAIEKARKKEEVAATEDHEEEEEAKQKVSKMKSCRRH